MRIGLEVNLHQWFYTLTKGCETLFTLILSNEKGYFVFNALLSYVR